MIIETTMMMFPSSRFYAIKLSVICGDSTINRACTYARPCKLYPVENAWRCGCFYVCRIDAAMNAATNCNISKLMTQEIDDTYKTAYYLDAKIKERYILNFLCIFWCMHRKLWCLMRNFVLQAWFTVEYSLDQRHSV